MIVVATDAPLSDRSLERLAKRGLAGLARTGASVPNDLISPLYQSAIEVIEEAIYNSLCMAETMEGYKGHKVHSLSLYATQNTFNLL